MKKIVVIYRYACCEGSNCPAEIRNYNLKRASEEIRDIWINDSFEVAVDKSYTLAKDNNFNIYVAKNEIIISDFYDDNDIYRPVIEIIRINDIYPRLEENRNRCLLFAEQDKKYVIDYFSLDSFYKDRGFLLYDIYKKYDKNAFDSSTLIEIINYIFDNLEKYFTDNFKLGKEEFAYNYDNYNVKIDNNSLVFELQIPQSIDAYNYKLYTILKENLKIKKLKN
jgi:hypothetical protein